MKSRTSEQTLIEVMRYLGPKATSCTNCKAGKEPESRFCACQCCYEAVCYEVGQVLKKGGVMDKKHGWCLWKPIGGFVASCFGTNKKYTQIRAENIEKKAWSELKKEGCKIFPVRFEIFLEVK